MAKRKKSFITGSFTLSKEHIELSRIAGVNQSELIDQYLINLEMDLKLKPGCLAVYFAENKEEYIEYFYTDQDNEEFLVEFETRIFSFGNNVDPILN